MKPVKRRDERQENRAITGLLRHLQAAGGNCRLQADADGCVWLGSGKSGRFVDPAILRSAISRGLAKRTGSKMQILAAGRDFLARSANPGDAFRAQHGEREFIVLEEGEAPTCVNIAESPLRRLYSRKTAGQRPWLGSAEFAAGERLRADFELAGLRQRITASWDPACGAGNGASNGQSDIGDMALDARARLDRALAVLPGEMADLVLDVCCFLKGLELVERERGWPPRSAKLLLRSALTVLAGHYGLAGARPRQPGEIRHWGAEGYRPAASVGR